MNLRFKKAGKNDLAVIAKLAESIWRKHYVTIITVEQIEYMLDKMYSFENLSKQMDEGHDFTVVYSDNLPIGYISLSSKDNENYFLHKFYVEVQDQGKGVGSQLLKHILDSLPKAKTIELTVNRKNYTAINFYFKNGFVIKAVEDFDIGNNYFMNDFVMIKRI